MTKLDKLPIGIESFEEIRTEGFYYIDKTGLIKELLNNWGKVNLFTRPRRFGKSLTMSMLKHFFSFECDKTLFDGLKIAQEHCLCEEYMGLFPVISISLKGVSGNTFESARSMLCSVIGNEAMQFQFLENSPCLAEQDKKLYRQLTTTGSAGQSMFIMTDDVLCSSLHTLSKLLQKHYGRKIIMLIDEYDVPLDKAQQHGYYDLMVSLIQNMFNLALKSNDNLYFAVLTGCLRISKESIFTGLNNPQVFSVTDVQFDEYFGFTDDDVRALLAYYGLSEHYNTIKEWYDGYRFGSIEVYCPWDVISYCRDLRTNPNAYPKDYWSNTSSNDIVKRFIQKANKTTTKREIESLIAGEIIRKEIHQELTYKDLDKTIDNLWSVLFTTGYLTQSGVPDGDIFELKIPNLEIRKIFTQQIYSWFQETAEQDGDTLNAFCEAFRAGDTVIIERLFNEYLRKTISIRDTFVQKNMKENFYHGILLGLLQYKEDWSVSSNRESGDGYSDIIIEIEDDRIGIIIEMKYPDSGNLERGCAEALTQIDDQNYGEVLQRNGMQTILKYGIACYKKCCKVISS